MKNVIDLLLLWAVIVLMLILIASNATDIEKLNQRIFDLENPKTTEVLNVK